MYLLRMRLSRLGPFEATEVAMSEEGEPRLTTVIHGSGGVGKTTLLMALSATRPGNAVVQPFAHTDREEPGAAICEFLLGQDDPERLHPLLVASPNTRVFAEEERESLRRREQATYDRVAREGGFVFVAIPAQRWFSRQQFGISAPGRAMARYDVRTPIALDEPTRGDLGRETKQALAYAAITRALGAQSESAARFERLAQAMQHAVDRVLELVGMQWMGLDPLTWEPLFRGSGVSVMTFDALPTRTRHLIAFVALPVRALWAAYPLRDPLQSEGVVAIDDVDVHQEPALLARLIRALREAIPCVQWLLTTTSPALATSCESHEVITLRRSHDRSTVEPFTGDLARTH